MRRARECAGRGGEGRVSGDAVVSGARVFVALLTVSLHCCGTRRTVLHVWHKLELSRCIRPLSSCY